MDQPVYTGTRSVHIHHVLAPCVRASDVINVFHPSIQGEGGDREVRNQSVPVPRL